MTLKRDELLIKLQLYFGKYFAISVDGKSLVIDRIRYNRAQFVKEFDKDKWYQLEVKVLAEKDAWYIKRMMEMLFDLLLLEHKSEMPQKLQVQVPSELGNNLDIEEARMQFIPILEKSTGEIFMIDMQTRRITDLHFDVWARMCGLNEVEKKKIIPRIGERRYNPLSLDSIKQVDYLKMTIVEVNTYIPPKWMLKTVDSPDPYPIPSLVDRFLKHLLPDETCRNYVFNWMRNMLVAPKNGTHLILCCGKGTGKTTFVELLESLVGFENYHKGPKDFLTSSYNTILEDKRLIFLDEVKVSKTEEIDTLKDYANRQQTINAKFKNTAKTKEIFCSFVLALNKEKDFRIEQDDRRFSVVELTEVPLLKIMTEKEVVALKEIFKDDDFLAGFGKWLTSSYFGEWGLEEPWLGEKFYRMAYLSLNKTKKFIIKKLKSKKQDRYYLEDLRLEFESSRASKRYAEELNYATVEGLLRTYKWRMPNGDFEPFGELFEEDNEWYLIPAPFFMPEDRSKLSNREAILEGFL